MARTGMAVLALIGLIIVAGGAWLLADSGALAASSSAPSVMIDQPLEKASYKLPDTAFPDEIEEFNETIEKASGRAPVRMKKDGDSVTWTVELEGDEYLTVTANLSAVSETKSELDVDVSLEDSPFTEDWGLLPADRPVLENVLDETFTEMIAAKLEDRPVDKSVGRRLELKMGLAKIMDRGFENRVEAALDGAVKPILKKYEEDARRQRKSSRSYGGSDYGGYEQEYRMRESQRQASEPTTYLPSNR